jgi:hypothetical protein
MFFFYYFLKKKKIELEKIYQIQYFKLTSDRSNYILILSICFCPLVRFRLVMSFVIYQWARMFGYAIFLYYILIFFIIFKIVNTYKICLFEIMF